jgi:type I restriction enzyme S subunit
MLYGIKDAQKGLIPGIERNDVLDLLCPLPPVSEQTRIVESIESVFSLLDTIDDLQKSYAADRDVLKGKLIGAAICGKLTKQLPEDGTAEELYKQIQEEKKYLEKEGKIKNSKKLPEITEDEIPFDIPANWKWVRLSDVLDVRDGTHDSPKYHDEGIPLVTSKNISGGSLSFDDVKLISEDDAKKINERSFVDDGDILFAMIGSIGNPVIVKKDRDFCIKNVALFKNISEKDLDMSYVYWFLMHEQYELRKTAIGGLQPFVSLKVFRNHLMPLPPIAEQKRISNRLYELSAAVTEQSL